MKPVELALFLSSFVRTRWGLRFRDRALFERWQARRLANFIGHSIQHARFYRVHRGGDLASLPIVDKSMTLAQFEAFNVRGISLADATAAAVAAEHSREAPKGFDPALTAGLSSGTQGPRGVFLASSGERATWAGILLGRTLDRTLLKDILTRRAPVRVAFFLRANSSLYTTLKSRRIDFRFFDLQQGAHVHAEALTLFAPDVLVAPASVLAWLAAESLAGRVPIEPRRVISVAEVLEPDDEQLIRRAYTQTVHQLYQCTEGFLAYTCEHGVLHLNEEFVHVEPEWLDASHTRFTPIVTDFTRRTQMIVRYRLNDILRVHANPCECGRVTRTLAAIDGRLDDVLWLPSSDGSRLLPLFPDVLRHAVTRELAYVVDYRIEQHGDRLHLDLRGDAADYDALTRAIHKLVVGQGMQAPAWQRAAMRFDAPGAKRRRIVCVCKPSLNHSLQSSVRVQHDA
jgi:putative adenylate-forming enzyme